MKNYIVVAESPISILESRVNDLLNQGYVLSRGVCVKSNENGSSYYYQAMYMEVKN